MGTRLVPENFDAGAKNMATSGEWKDVAHRQSVRADRAERKVEAQEHALNLLLNGQMVEFHTAVTADGTCHDLLPWHCSECTD
jgi:hypothetical protein